MNWKLIFGLSLFGLAMSIATIYWLPADREWIFWIPILFINAYAIAKNAPGKYFMHGFLVSLANCVWITGLHVLMFSTMMEHRPETWEMVAKMPMPEHPRMMMLVMGPIIGIASGLVNGLFAFIASKIVKK